jgi:3-dehydroquinate dehydratase-2
MHFLALQGPNLNRLGTRKPERYGRRTLAEIQADMDLRARELGATLAHVQSNSEGALIDWLQERQDGADGMILNPAGLTNYGRSLRDALDDTEKPVAIVHISTVHNREAWRVNDVFAEIASAGYVMGLGWRGYLVAIEALVHRARGD